MTQATQAPPRWRAWLAEYWAACLALLFVMLLPVGRQIELPVTVFAFSLAFLARDPANRDLIGQAARFILPLFLCIWIPMLLSSFDSLDAAKSWKQTLPALRFLATALAVAVLLRRPGALPLFCRLTCWLLLFWAADGYFQLTFGFDVFGIPMHEDRLNALFFDSYFSYGPTLALLSPIALDHMRRHWPGLAWIGGFAFILGAVLISGMRAAWVMMVVIMVVFMIASLRQKSWRQTIVLPLAAIAALAIAVASSPLMQERLKLSSLVAGGTAEAIDEASSYRLPIFRHALEMYRDHPINGVGVRAMRAAYPLYAPPDDPHIVFNPEKNRAHQAHNIVLEFMTDTGTIGLLGLVAAFVLAVRYWRGLDPSARARAFPFAVTLLAIAFPLNSYFSMFGVYMMSVIWIVVGLFTAASLPPTRAP